MGWGMGGGGVHKKKHGRHKTKHIDKGKIKKKVSAKKEKQRAYNRAPTGPEHKKRHGQYNEKHLAHMNFHYFGPTPP